MHLPDEIIDFRCLYCVYLLLCELICFCSSSASPFPPAPHSLFVVCIVVDKHIENMPVSLWLCAHLYSCVYKSHFLYYHTKMFVPFVRNLISAISHHKYKHSYKRGYRNHRYTRTHCLSQFRLFVIIQHLYLVPSLANLRRPLILPFSHFIGNRLTGILTQCSCRHCTFSS